MASKRYCFCCRLHLLPVIHSTISLEASSRKTSPTNVSTAQMDNSKPRVSLNYTTTMQDCDFTINKGTPHQYLVASTTMHGLAQSKTTLQSMKKHSLTEHNLALHTEIAPLQCHYATKPKPAGWAVLEMVPHL